MVYHKPWKPMPAAKPTHLTIPIQSSSNSLAALQGANLAFLTGSRSPVSKVQPNESTTSLQRQNTNESNHVSNSAERPPSRGRHLGPADVPVNEREDLQKGLPSPGMLSRSPSMIAARLASASSSPAREYNTNKSAASLQREASYTSTNTRSDNLLQRNMSYTSYTSQSSNNEVQDTPKLDFKNTPRIPLPRADSAGPRLYVNEPKSALLGVSQPLSATASTSISPFAANQSSFDTRRNLSVRPAPPAPRRSETRTPLKPNLTGPQQATKQTRDEIINRMADAMVASSLASSRPASPSKAPKRHGYGRRSSSASNMYRIPLREFQPPPKYVRPMKQTLRKHSSDGEDEIETTKRGRRHLVRKHVNQHHEGDRKRWKDKVTEMERRRYEGVFAANRGLLLKPADLNASPSRQIDPTSQSNHVVNIVVRDIWERSRLPGQVLEQIYDLVEGGQMLNREQFVVGLWLIDQSLKGRKLPVNVSDSVWASVRHSRGIKVRNHGR